MQNERLEKSRNESVKILAKLRKKQTFKVFDSISFSGLNNDNIIYFQALLLHNNRLSPYYDDYAYSHYFVIDNNINKEYIDFFSGEENLHKEIISNYDATNDHFTQVGNNNYDINYNFTFTVFGIYKNKEVVKELLNKGLSPFISHNIGLNHNDSPKSIVSNIISGNLLCSYRTRISPEDHIKITNTPSGKHFYKYSHYSRYSIDRIQKDRFWLATFYELALHDDENIELKDLLKDKSFYNMVLSRANTGVFPYNAYFSLIWSMFFNKLDLAVLNTVKRRNTISSLSKKDIISLYNNIDNNNPSQNNLSFVNSAYTIDVTANTPYLEEIIEKWIFNVKNQVEETSINDSNIIEILSYSDMRNRVSLFKDSTKDNKIILDNPLLLSQSIVLEKYNNGFTNNKRQQVFIKTLNNIGTDYVRNKIKVSELLLLQEILGKTTSFLSNMTTNEMDIFLTEIINYAQNNDIDYPIVFRFLFDLHDSVIKIDDAFIVFSENNFLEQYHNNGVSGKMLLEILGVNYTPRGENPKDNAIWEYKKLNY